MTKSDSNAYAREQHPISYERIGFGWGPVLAGLAVAMAVNIFLAEIALWLNLGIVDTESSAGTVAIVNGIAWVLSAAIAVFAGAWLAGRMANTRSSAEGGLHGITVWAGAGLVMLMLTFSAVRVVGGGMVGLVGEGLSTAGQAVEVAMPSWGTIREEMEGALDEVDAGALASADSDTGTEAGANAEGDADAGPITAGGQQFPEAGETRIRDRSRIFELAGSYFSLDAGPDKAADREELVQLIASNTGISKSTAEETLTQWDGVWNNTVDSYESAKAEAVQAAEAAREFAMAAAGWAALGMLLSAVAAIAGGAYGATCRLRLIEDQAVTPPDRTITPTSPRTQRAEREKAQPIR